jgi:hypothetical protein
LLYNAEHKQGDGGVATMSPTKYLIAGAIIALMMTGAQAQLANTPQGLQMQSATNIGQQASRANDSHTDNAAKVKANDKAYNAALKNLPDKQYDPWGGVR